MSKYYKAEEVISLLKAHAKDGDNRTFISDETAYAIENFPTIEVSEGKWTKRETVGSVDFAYCSECKQPIIHGHTSPLWNYCPNCGAKMR